MRLAGCDVLPIQMAVEFDRGIDLLHDGIGAAGETPAPRLVAHDTTEGFPSMTSESGPQRVAKRRWPLMAAGGIAGVAVGLAAVYGIATLAGNPGGDPACRPAVKVAKRLAPLARGEIAALIVA